MQSAISTKLLCNFIKITPTYRQARENLLNTLLRENISGGLLLDEKRILKYFNYKTLLITVVKINFK